VAEIRLIVGLGNPGPRYEHTRHNVGAIWVESLAARFGIRLANESRFQARVGRGDVLGHDVRLMVPNTFMNLSGDAVGPLAHFLKVAPEAILVAYDEVAFEPGVARLKQGGGDNGHNGVHDVIRGLGNRAEFVRLRIGVGHPGDPERMSGYLTGTRVPKEERAKIDDALAAISDDVLRNLLSGALGKAMNVLHTKNDASD
jgi:peptidyl-tRNA hydrolase, PTH1 family